MTKQSIYKNFKFCLVRPLDGNASYMSNKKKKLKKNIEQNQKRKRES